MRIIRQPTVYLIGSQVTNDTEIERFLADHGVETWTTDTLVAGEKLAELAGRVCYMSFAKPRPGGNKAYLDRILESAHGSVHARVGAAPGRLRVFAAFAALRGRIGG